jgi:hypothetical protein
LLQRQAVGKKGASILEFLEREMRVIMQKADTWKEQMGYYRFWENKKVTAKELTECAVKRCAEQCAGLEEVLLLQDTTEMNRERNRERIKDKRGLGVVGNGTDLGFFCHPTVAVTPKDHAIMGALDIYTWSRESGIGDRKTRHNRYGGEPIEQKETYRWISCAIRAKGQLQTGQKAIVVQDREGDIYESLYVLREQRLEYVIRASHDRRLAGREEHLNEYMNGLGRLFEYNLEVTGNNKTRKKRTAQMEIRYGKVVIKRSKNLANREAYPEQMEIPVVYEKEKAESVPQNEQPIEWMLYTTYSVENKAEALKIVGYYRCRWLIEDLFRTIKSEGVNYEESELESGAALGKLFLMSFIAAMQILQLRQARNGETEQKGTLVFSKEQLECMEELSGRYEGKTEKQKNPYNRENLAWAVWYIARIGGWKGYASQRPPGVIILHDGWIRFQNIFIGWCAAKDVYNR